MTLRVSAVIPAQHVFRLPVALLRGRLVMCGVRPTGLRDVIRLPTPQVAHLLLVQVALKRSTPHVVDTRCPK
jgi:hypothetical protein